MAFNPSAAASTPSRFAAAGINTNNNAGGPGSHIPDAKKAVGFLNIYLPTADGGKAKLGAIALTQGNEREARLAEWLIEKPERLGKLVSQLQFEFNVVKSAEASAFVLPAD